MTDQPAMRSRKPRADAIRNRERVLEAAKAVFSQGGPAASLEAVAKQAGVGIVEDPASGAANGLIGAYIALSEPAGSLARGYRGLTMLESGEAKSITELAAREKIDNSYMCRMLNLSTLTPDFVAAILDETLPSHLTVHELAISPPVLWEEQRARICVVGEELQD